MKIDYRWGSPPRKPKVRKRRWWRHQPVPNHVSNHYVKEHFDPNAPPKLF